MSDVYRNMFYKLENVITYSEMFDECAFAVPAWTLSYKIKEKMKYLLSVVVILMIELCNSN